MTRESSIKVGDVFNRLTVIKKLGKTEYNGKSPKRTLFLCECSCGSIKEIDAGNLKKGVKSCGCLHKEVARENGKKQRTKDGYIRHLQGECRRAAKNRGYVFELSFDDYKEIVIKDCFYCGQPPTMRNLSKVIVGIQIPTNGVDRKDNTKGYTLNNSVPCCSICNRMKLDLTEEDFYKHIERIYEFRK